MFPWRIDQFLFSEQLCCWHNLDSIEKYEAFQSLISHK